MIRSVKYLMKWYLWVRKLYEIWLRGWSCCVSQLRQYRLKECGLKLNTLRLEWRDVKLEFLSTQSLS